MDRERLDKWCERGILGLVLAILVVAPTATGAVRTIDFVIVQGLTIGVVALWGIRMWANPRHHLWWPPICWAVLAFVAYAIVRYHGAPVEYTARQELIRVIVYAFLFFAIVNNLNRQESTQLIVMVLIGLAVAISAYAIFQIVTGSEKVLHYTKPVQYANRGGGTFINPNHLAGFLAMLLPLALSYTLIGRLSHGAKIVLGYGAAVMLIGIGVTLSRGGWIALGVALGVLFTVLLFQRDFRIRAIIALSLLGIVAGGVFIKSQTVKERVDRVFVEHNTDLMRLSMWRSAIGIWKEHPLWGAGPGHYDHFFRQHRSPEIQGRPQYVHNDYLQALTDWGIAGALLIGLALGLLAWGVLRTWPHVQRAPNDFGTKRSNKSTFVLGASAGLVALLAHSILDFNMQIPSNAILAVTLMALLSGYLRYATERFWVTPGVTVKIMATVIGLAGIGFLGQQGWQRAREHALLQQARQQPEASLERAAILKRAFAVEPMNPRTSYAIGEIYRALSWQGDRGYELPAEEAMIWFRRGMDLNPPDPYNYLRYGMCLAWLDRVDDAGPYFERARELDPNGHYIAAHMGWYYVQRNDYLTAREWFQRSLKLLDNYQNRNDTAWIYLQIVNRRLAEAGELPDR